MKHRNRFLFNWHLYALLLFCVARLHADEARAKRLQAKKQQQALTRLLKDYQHVRTAELKENFIEEAIKRGRPFTDGLKRQVAAERKTHLQAYRQMFLAAIDDAPRILPSSIVSTSDQLKKRRDDLILLYEWTNRLSDQITASKESSVSRDDETKRSPAKQVRKNEELYISQWLTAKGVGRITKVEAALIQQVNRLRAEEDLPPLKVDFKLCAAARDHSLDMTVERFFSHKSELRNKLTHLDRAIRFGTSAKRENIANCPSPGMVVPMWKASPGHKRAMLDPHAHRVGVGHIGRKYTMMFGTGKIPKTEAKVAKSER